MHPQYGDRYPDAWRFFDDWDPTLPDMGKVGKMVSMRNPSEPQTCLERFSSEDCAFHEDPSAWRSLQDGIRRNMRPKWVHNPLQTSTASIPKPDFLSVPACTVQEPDGSRSTYVSPADTIDGYASVQQRLIPSHSGKRVDCGIVHSKNLSFPVADYSGTTTPVPSSLRTLAAESPVPYLERQVHRLPTTIGQMQAPASVSLPSISNARCTGTTTADEPLCYIGPDITSKLAECKQKCADDPFCEGVSQIAFPPNNPDRTMLRTVNRIATCGPPINPLTHSETFHPITQTVHEAVQQLLPPPPPPPPPVPGV